MTDIYPTLPWLLLATTVGIEAGVHRSGYFGWVRLIEAGVADANERLDRTGGHWALRPCGKFARRVLFVKTIGRHAEAGITLAKRASSFDDGLDSRLRACEEISFFDRAVILCR